MKRIKLIAVALSLTILSGCVKTNSSPSGSNERIVWTYGNADEKGELYTDSEERLHFADFDTMQSAVLCSKPNCPHTNEKDCSSFGMSNHPILYDGKLYFFDVQTNFDGDEITDITTVYQAEPDGTSRTKVSTIEGLALLNYTRMLIVDNKAYFSMDKTGWNDDRTATSGYNEVWLCSFDFSTGKFERIEKLHEGWCSGTWIYGLYDSNVIFSYAYSEEKVPYLEDPSEIGKYFTYVYKTYDTESGELTELTLPEPMYVGGGYYVYEKDDGAIVLSENGKEMTLPDFPVNGNLTLADGKLFNCFGQTCADLSDGKTYFLKYSDDLTAYADGFYILKNLNNYTKISEKDYIGDEL